MRRSILTEKVARRGHHVVREYIVNPLARVRVEDVDGARCTGAAGGRDHATAGKWLAERDPRMGHRYAWPMVMPTGQLVGLLTRGDLMKGLERDGGAEATVRKAGTSALVVTYPDEVLEEAVGKMARHHIGRLPVVDRAEPTKLLGYLGRAAIAAAWRLLLNEEEVREAGWLTAQGRLFRMQVRRVLGRFTAP